MEKRICNVIINNLSGHANRLSEAKIESMLSEFSVEFFYIEHIDDTLLLDEKNTFAVCGGDGTLNHALNSKLNNLYYIPCGTLNETSKTTSELSSVGQIGGRKFAYVAAAGSFTEIGYTVKNKTKQKFKVLAYLSAVIKHYKVHKIPAELAVDGAVFKGDFSLIMLLNSNRCFGFNFNALHGQINQNLTLVLIKTPSKPFALIKLFFPFFRVFFVGIRKPLETKNIIARQFSTAQIKLSNQTPFCLDGEKYCPEQISEICASNLPSPIKILHYK
jgi:diacylglycerol kinase family enzyme